MKRSRMSFQLKGIELTVHDTDAVVKADKILTLFMLNTIADNARKFTEKGGSVEIGAQQEQDYVELFVKDTGKGMTEEQLASSSPTRFVAVMALACSIVGALSSVTRKSASTLPYVPFRPKAAWGRAVGSSFVCLSAFVS